MPSLNEESWEQLKQVLMLLAKWQTDQQYAGQWNQKAWQRGITAKQFLELSNGDRLRLDAEILLKKLDVSKPPAVKAASTDW